MEQLQSLPRVERYVRERRSTDQVFINWGVYYFILTWATFGIYPLIIFYRRLDRADLFRERRLHYFTAVIDATREYAEAHGHDDATVHSQLDDLQHFVKERFTDEHAPIEAGKSLLLSFVALGIYGLYAVYRMMRFWWQIQLTEQDFDEKLSIVWTELNIVRYPITFEPVLALNRGFGMHILLTLATVGIYGIIWDFQLHTDPEKLYPETRAAEDAVVAALRNAAPAYHATAG